MKNLDEVLKDKRVVNVFRNVENDRSRQVKLEVISNVNNKTALVKFTKAVGWEHLSVSFQDETPSWDVMNEMKEMFWKDNEVCFQLHPAKDNYINNHEHCLHIWKPVGYQIPVPPTILIGFRKGHEEEDKKDLLKLQEDLGSPISEEYADFMLKMALDPKGLEKELENELMKLSPMDIARILGGQL